LFERLTNERLLAIGHRGTSEELGSRIVPIDRAQLTKLTSLSIQIGPKT
jgi:hypothetical protein